MELNRGRASSVVSARYVPAIGATADNAALAFEATPQACRRLADEPIGAPRVGSKGGSGGKLGEAQKTGNGRGKE